MSLFDNLLIGHLAGDFLFQTSWMADGKIRRIVPLILHATVYTLCVFVFSAYVGSLCWTDYLIIWGSHVLIDSRKFTYWWIRTVMRVTRPLDNKDWLTIVVDQAFHLSVFYILLLLKAQ